MTSDIIEKLKRAGESTDYAPELAAFTGIGLAQIS
jgi:hypothetical protein